jgi:hypothetical protein
MAVSAWLPTPFVADDADCCDAGTCRKKDLFKVDLDDLSWVASTARAVTGLDARRRPGSNAKQALQG